MMRWNKLHISAALIAFAAVAALFYFRSTAETKSPRRPSGALPSSVPAAGLSGAGQAQTEPAGTPSPETHEDASARLQAAQAALMAQRDPAANRKLLAGLRAFLGTLPKAAATAAVSAFLDGGSDAPTGLDFSVGAGGALTGANTLRVFLLDLLAGLDPRAAADYAARILQTPTSPDEWAIALRNYARVYATPEATAFLRGKAEEMIQNPGWLEKPSGGFLEAFDVFVHTKDIAATPLLAKLVRAKEERGATHAAFLTLDRLVIAEPRAVFAYIEQQPDLFKGRELMQSNFVARADVGDRLQRTQVENYLLSLRRTPGELEAFAGVFPNANYMISENLLTTTATPAHAELAARDRTALKVTEEWLADPRFDRIKPHLQALRNRLQHFVDQASGRDPK